MIIQILVLRCHTTIYLQLIYHIALGDPTLKLRDIGEINDMFFEEQALSNVLALENDRLTIEIFG